MFERIHYQTKPPKDYREIGLQVGALLLHLYAAVHHAHRLTLVLMGKRLGRGL